MTGEQPPSNNGPLLGNTFYPTFTACYRTELEQFCYWKKADYILKLYVIMQNYKQKQRDHFYFVLQKWLNSFQALFSIKCVGCGFHLKEETENVFLPPCWRTFEDLSPYHYQCRP